MNLTIDLQEVPPGVRNGALAIIQEPRPPAPDGFIVTVLTPGEKVDYYINSEVLARVRALYAGQMDDLQAAAIARRYLRAYEEETTATGVRGAFASALLREWTSALEKAKNRQPPWLGCTAGLFCDARHLDLRSLAQTAEDAAALYGLCGEEPFNFEEVHLVLGDRDRCLQCVITEPQIARLLAAGAKALPLPRGGRWPVPAAADEGDALARDRQGPPRVGPLLKRCLFAVLRMPHSVLSHGGQEMLVADLRAALDADYPEAHMSAGDRRC